MGNGDMGETWHLSIKHEDNEGFNHKWFEEMLLKMGEHGNLTNKQNDTSNWLMGLKGRTNMDI
jgi:hypothetical protein